MALAGAAGLVSLIVSTAEMNAHPGVFQPPGPGLCLTGALPSRPAPSGGGAAGANDSRVTLVWDSSELATSYVLEAGTGPGRSDLYVGDVGNTTSLPVTAPPGTYYVRVRARNAAGLSHPSEELRITLGDRVGGGCQVPPVSPSGLVASVSGTLVVLQWSSTAEATSYQLEAGTAWGAANLLVTDVGNLTFVQAAAPPGTYFVRVRARNPCGTSGASNEVRIVVP